MKSFKGSIVHLIICCLLYSSVVWAADKAGKEVYERKIDKKWFEELFGANGFLGYRINTRSRTIIYPHTADEFVDWCKDKKGYRVTAGDFYDATQQAVDFVGYLFEESVGCELLRFFSRAGMLELIIQRGFDLDSKGFNDARLIAHGLTLGIIHHQKKELKRDRGSFVMQQFLEYHFDELEFGRNPNLLRAIFQNIRLYFLLKDPFKSSKIIYEHKFGFKPIKILQSTTSRFWHISNDETCFAMYGIFKILEIVYNTFSLDEQELIDSFLTHEEKTRVDRRIAAENT